ncbi:hypothetical protein GPECTOR_53g107 [Gonium pectorale]|uniref:MYND-type domain-containing protein n=1 Tax=Gonium pectorale TaxID=33097 RepID=A0A150G6S0_GONPE|nr:hypothetical protein GPECTOR_53g107 [Gonium pectorale]|eukprot:KXZ45521.1 hypothetical protein GPECTOR_53g107 [Gonium pectorale]
MPPRLARAQASSRNNVKRKEDARSRSLARLQALAAKVLAEVDNRSFRLSQADVESAVKDVSAADEKGESADGHPWPGLWLASGPQHWPALLALYALALRRSCASLDTGVSDGMRAAYTELRRALIGSLMSLKAPDTTQQGRAIYGQLVRLRLAVVRSHAFRCYAALLSGAADQLTQRRSARNAHALRSVTDDAFNLISSFHGYLGGELDSAFTAELRASGLLEQWARAVVMLASYGNGIPLDPNYAAMYLMNLGIDSSSAGDLRGRPCLSYLLSCHMVQLCAALDGGPTYGLPKAGEGPGAAPKLVTESAEMDSYLAQCGLEMWENTIRRAREERGLIDAAAAPAIDGACLAGGVGPENGVALVPPLNRRAAFRVAMRLVAAAFAAVPRAQGAGAAAGAAAGAGGGGAAAGAAAGPQAAKVSPSQAMSLLLRALECAREACREEAACAAGAAPPGALSRLGRLWEVRLAAAERAQLVESDESLHDRFTQRWQLWDFQDLVVRLEPAPSAGTALPAAPSLDVAAALGAGYVARIERMMRRCSPEVRTSLMLLDEFDPVAWAQVLAFGPLRDMLSLLATAAKKVRKNAAEPCTRYHTGIESVGLLLSPVPLQLLRGLAAGGAAADLGPFEVGELDSFAAGPPRLRAAVSYIAHHLLPTAFRAMPPIVLNSCFLDSSRYFVTISLLRWLPVLAAARTTLPWASSLLSGPEWGLAELLGCTLGQALHGAMNGGSAMRGLLPALVEALRALCLLAPELLAEALPGAVAFASRAVFGPGSDLPQPELLAALERLRTGTATGCDPAAAPSGSTSASSSPVVVPDLPADPAEWVAAAALLLSPADLRLLLPGCANPRCANLAGPSELALQLPVRGGAGDGAVAGDWDVERRYCSQGCAEEHCAAVPGR